MGKNNNIFFRQYSIRKKIGLVYGICIIPILIVLIMSVILIIRNVISKNIEILVTNNSGIIVKQIESKMQNAENCANIMLGYLNEIEFLREEYKSEISDLNKHNQVLKVMTYAYRVFTDVDGMVFVDQKGNVYGDDTKIERVFQNKYPYQLLEEMNKNGGKAKWFPMNAQNSFSKVDNQMTLTLGKNIVDIFSGERLGVLFVIIEEDSISKVYENLRLSENAYYVITDKLGEVVSSPKKEELGENYLMKKQFGNIDHAGGVYSRGQYLFIQYFEEAPYLLMFHAPFTELIADTLQLVIYISIFGGVCIFIAFYLAAKLAKKITEPIIDLSKAMDEVSKGDIQVRCNIHSMDETKLIGDGFNHMLDTIEKLIVNVEEEQRSKRKYEMALIQSQIKPHFLYNTLDTIYVLSHMGRNDEAKNTVKALADFYRVSLSAGKEMISLASEIKCTEDYLKIQGIRYAEEFYYEIDIDTQWNDIKILKLTLQPLVENAIYHGLKEKEGEGKLRIYAEEIKSALCICVEDNGCGMTEEKRRSLFTKESENSFGIKNLNHRIKMYFGTSYGIEVQSKEGIGTLVKVYIPKTGGENDEVKGIGSGR